MKTRTKIPMRQCTGCREMKSKKEMIRVLKTSENEIILDATGKKNGRGAYLCFSEECLEKAIKNHGLERSLKMAVPDEVYQNLKKEFESIEKQESLGRAMGKEFRASLAVQDENFAKAIMKELEKESGR